MRRLCAILLITATLLAHSGCVFSIGGSKKSCPPSPECNTCAISSTMVEIDAAGELSSEESRMAIYRALANRPGLSSAERAHLVEAVGDNLTSEEDRAEVLLLLAQN